jgi:ABC-type cobalamin/Fe3+-siderophores transport system ATPase subunit
VPFASRVPPVTHVVVWYDRSITSMHFKVLPVRENPRAGREQAFLVRDNWDDYSFKTTYTLFVFDKEGERHRVGQVKIGRFGMGDEGRTAIPEAFDSLDEGFFSLGQDANYYETLNVLTQPLKERTLLGLRDVANDALLFEKALGEAVMRHSLLRFVTERAVLRHLSRIVRGDVELTNFAFTYTFPRTQHPVTLSFHVTPLSLPPTNIHVLIGRNGVGKTRCLNRMTQALVAPENETLEGVFHSENETGNQPFAGLASVTFSAFDPFEPLSPPTADNRIRYEYIGLKQLRTANGDLQPPKTVEELAGDFVNSAVKCRTGPRAVRWQAALQRLQADPLFEQADVAALVLEDDDDRFETEARRLYQRLSSGHKIVLLTITRLVEAVDERTLVLLDEPEAHLHPPLLAAFVRSLSDLLVRRNGVALIATHSPVVLQEVPKSCVWILRRSGAVVQAERPTIETFGENVGTLTREVFGLEVTLSGFHQLIEQEVAKNATYRKVLEAFGEQLGAEGRAIASALRATADQDEDDPEEQG